METLFEMFIRLGDSAVATGAQIGVSLADTAMSIAAALFALFFTLRSVKFALSNHDSFGEWMGEVFEKLMLVAIITWILKTPGVYQDMMLNWIWGAVQYLVGVVGGATWSNSSAGSRGAVMAITLSLNDTMNGLNSAVGEAGKHLFTSNPVSWVTGLLSGVTAGLLVMLAMLIIIFANAMILVSFTLGAVLYGVGAALGPLFLVTLLHEKTEGYFWSWFRFVLQSAAVLLVATVIAGVVGKGLKAVIGQGGYISSQLATAEAQARTTGSMTDTMLVAFIAIMAALFIAYLFSQVQEITTALFSGNVGGIRSGGRAALGGAAAPVKNWAAPSLAGKGSSMRTSPISNGVTPKGSQAATNLGGGSTAVPNMSLSGMVLGGAAMAASAASAVSGNVAAMGAAAGDTLSQGGAGATRDFTDAAANSQRVAEALGRGQAGMTSVPGTTTGMTADSVPKSSFDLGGNIGAINLASDPNLRQQQMSSWQDIGGALGFNQSTADMALGNVLMERGKDTIQPIVLSENPEEAKQQLAEWAKSGLETVKPDPVTAAARSRAFNPPPPQPVASEIPEPSPSTLKPNGPADPTGSKSG